MEQGQENPRGGWYSSRYGRIEPAPCLSLSAEGRLPFFSATLLLPYKGPVPPRVAFALEADAVVVESEETGEIRARSTLA